MTDSRVYQSEHYSIRYGVTWIITDLFETLAYSERVLSYPNNIGKLAPIDALQNYLGVYKDINGEFVKRLLGGKSFPENSQANIDFEISIDFDLIPENAINSFPEPYAMAKKNRVENLKFSDPSNIHVYTYNLNRDNER